MEMAWLWLHVLLRFFVVPAVAGGEGALRFWHRRQLTCSGCSVLMSRLHYLAAFAAAASGLLKLCGLRHMQAQ